MGTTSWPMVPDCVTGGGAPGVCIWPGGDFGVGRAMTGIAGGKAARTVGSDGDGGGNGGARPGAGGGMRMSCPMLERGAGRSLAVGPCSGIGAAGFGATAGA